MRKPAILEYGFWLATALISAGCAVAETDSFKFEGGSRRDPFSYTINAYPHSFPTPAVIACGCREMLEVVRRAERQYVAAEDAFKNLHAAEAVTAADDGLALFKIDDFQKNPLAAAVSEKLQRIRKAGERLKHRQVAEREFATLNLRVTGVVEKDGHSMALVNQRVVGKGDLVATTQDNQAVVVDEIIAEQVVVLYKGYRSLLVVSAQ